MNTTILKWLEAGHIREAVLGRGNYFLADHTYRSSHDRLLVLFTILEWANVPEKMNAATKTYEKILTESNEENDIEMMRDLLVCYDIATKTAKKYLKLDMLFWRKRFCSQLLHHLDFIRKTESWRRSVKSMTKRFPELKVVLENITNNKA